jgi:hypothetical protein
VRCVTVPLLLLSCGMKEARPVSACAEAAGKRLRRTGEQRLGLDAPCARGVSSRLGKGSSPLGAPWRQCSIQKSQTAGRCGASHPLTSALSLGPTNPSHAHHSPSPSSRTSACRVSSDSLAGAHPPTPHNERAPRGPCAPPRP